MPSLVKYAHDILSEDRYGYRALEKVDERIQSLNDAQLVGMVTHLSGSMSRAQSELWRYANRMVLEAVKNEFEIREEQHRQQELDDYHAHREEREREELEELRRVERQAAEKQISRTAEREAREDVEKFMVEFRTKSKIKHMKATYRARNIRSYSWSVTFIFGIGTYVVGTVQEENRTTTLGEDQTGILTLVFGIFITATSLLVGWRFGEAKESVKTAAQIEEMVEERKAERLVEFFERDRITRQKIEMQDMQDAREKAERIRARKAEKRRLRRIEKERKTAADIARKTLEDKRRAIFMKNVDGNEPKDLAKMTPDGLLTLAAKAAVAEVDAKIQDKKVADMEEGVAKPETNDEGDEVVDVVVKDKAENKKAGVAFGVKIATIPKVAPEVVLEGGKVEELFGGDGEAKDEGSVGSGEEGRRERKSRKTVQFSVLPDDLGLDDEDEEGS